jgi:eukaryotic-like serine/threonine-protein kinase
MGASAHRRQVAGRYDLGAPLGRGGMGVVWRATDTLLGRPVAVKEVALPPGELAQVRDRALREARASARLSHPGVVTLHDVVEEDGRLFLVMELVDAPTLRELVAAGGPLAPAGAARLGLDLLDALEAAHRAGVVHRDVKPGNVMVPAAGPAKLADFGIAALAEDAQRTLTGTPFGSLPYAAPEQVAGQPAGPAADLWALGATLWFAVEGAAPFDRGDPAATVAAILRDPPGCPARAGPLAPALEALLAKAPERRPAGAALRRLLGPAARGGPTPTAPLPPDPVGPTRPLARDAGRLPGWGPPPVAPAGPGLPRRRGRRLLGVAGGLLVLLLAAALNGGSRGRAGRAATAGLGGRCGTGSSSSWSARSTAAPAGCAAWPAPATRSASSAWSG